MTEQNTTVDTEVDVDGKADAWATIVVITTIVTTAAFWLLGQ